MKENKEKKNIIKEKIKEICKKFWKEITVKESVILVILEIIYFLIQHCFKNNASALNFVSFLIVIVCIIMIITFFVFYVKVQSDIKEFNTNSGLLILTIFFASIIVLYLLVNNTLTIELFFDVLISFGFFWFCYYLACRKILKEIDLNEMLVFTITALKSIANSFLSCSIIFAFLYTLPKSDKNSQMIALPKVIVALFTLYYPVADMYMYTRRKINDYQKEKDIEAKREKIEAKREKIEAEREKIENESNGSKNYTA